MSVLFKSHISLKLETLTRSPLSIVILHFPPVVNRSLFGPKHVSGKIFYWAFFLPSIESLFFASDRSRAIRSVWILALKMSFRICISLTRIAHLHKAIKHEKLCIFANVPVS